MNVNLIMMGQSNIDERQEGRPKTRRQKNGKNEERNLVCNENRKWREGGENEKRRKKKKESNVGCLVYILPFRSTGAESQ